MANNYWGWADSKKDEISSPLSKKVQASGEQAQAHRYDPSNMSPIDAQLQAFGVNKALEAGVNGVTTGVEAAMAPAAATVAPMAVQGASLAPTANILAGSGIGNAAAASTLAPTALSGALGSAGIAGGTTAAGATLASAAPLATTAATGMGPALMAGMASNPIGWAVGAYMAGSALGLWS